MLRTLLLGLALLLSGCASLAPPSSAARSQSMPGSPSPRSTLPPPGARGQSLAPPGEPSAPRTETLTQTLLRILGGK